MVQPRGIRVAPPGRPACFGRPAAAGRARARLVQPPAGAAAGRARSALRLEAPSGDADRAQALQRARRASRSIYVTTTRGGAHDVVNRLAVIQPLAPRQIVHAGRRPTSMSCTTFVAGIVGILDISSRMIPRRRSSCEVGVFTIRPEKVRLPNRDVEPAPTRALPSGDDPRGCYIGADTRFFVALETGGEPRRDAPEPGNLSMEALARRGRRVLLLWKRSPLLCSPRARGVPMGKGGRETNPCWQ
jgi:hypothetical protein